MRFGKNKLAKLQATQVRNYDLPTDSPIHVNGHKELNVVFVPALGHMEGPHLAVSGHNGNISMEKHAKSFISAIKSAKDAFNNPTVDSQHC